MNIGMRMGVFFH